MHGLHSVDAHVSHLSVEATVAEAAAAAVFAGGAMEHVTADEAAGAAVDGYVIEAPVMTVAAAVALRACAGPVLVDNLQQIVGVLQLGVQLGVQIGVQLRTADQQTVLACLLGHCCEMQSLHKQGEVGPGGLKAGGQTLLVVSEWRKMWMAVVRGGCRGAGGRVWHAGTQ